MAPLERSVQAIYQGGRFFPLVSDVAAWIAAGALAYVAALTFSTGTSLLALLLFCLVGAAITAAFASSLGVYRRRWRIASFDEATASGLAWFASTVVLLVAVIASRVWGWEEPRISAVLSAAVLAGAVMAATRIAWRRSWEHTKRQIQGRSSRILVIGARDGGADLIKTIVQDTESNLLPVGILEDSDDLQSREIEGVSVRGKIRDLAFVASALDANVAFVTRDVPPAERQAVIDLAVEAGLSVVDVPTLTEADERIEILSSTKSEPKLSLVANELLDEDGRPAPRRKPLAVDTARPRRFRLPKALLAVGDAAVLSGTLVAALLVASELSVALSLRYSVLAALLFLFLLSQFDLYGDKWLPTRRLVPLLVRPLLVTVVIVLLSAFVAPGNDRPFGIMAVGTLVSAAGVLLWRTVASNIENRIRGRELVLVVVDTDTTTHADQQASLERLSKASGDHVALDAVLDFRDVEQIVDRAQAVDLVMLTAAVPDVYRASLMSDLSAMGAPVFLIPSTLDVALSTGGASYFHTVEGILVADGEVSALTRVVKRSIDIAVSALALLILLPIAVAVAIAIRIDSPGRAIYSQTRVGKNHELFRIHKFRSMRNDAEAATGAVLAVAGDARVTRVGSILRRTRLDEIPQLWNVILGEMSLVGPRPERPEFVETFNETVDGYSRRARVRPGVTGLAQVKAGYSATVEEKLRFDLTYVNNLRIATDFKIAIQTVATMIDFSAAEGTTDSVEISDNVRHLLREAQAIRSQQVAFEAAEASQ